MTSHLPQPSIEPPREWLFPTPERHRLDNGLAVAIYRMPGQHVISGHLVIDAPLDTEPRDLEGVATICARTLDEGTRRHGGEEFAEQLETLGAGFGVDVSLAGLQAVLDVPASRLRPALDLFAEAAIEPAFADSDVERHVTLRLAEIDQVYANPAQSASVAFRSGVFAAESRASRMNSGQPDTVAAVTPESVRAFHHDHFRPDRATLVLAGDFAEDPLPLIIDAFGGWTVAEPGQPAPEHRLPRPAEPRAVIIDHPGAVQADLRLGGFGIDRTDPRWADVTVAGYAVGGAFLSRLNAVLREDRGYTYGVHLAFGPLRRAGSYAVQGAFRTEVAAAALAEGRELLDLAEKPITADEVRDAVAYYTGVSPLRYATADGVADQAGSQVLAGLDDDHLNRNLAELRQVTPESATAGYRSVVDLDRLSLAVAGDAEKLAEPIRALGYDLVVLEHP
ncbi:M16 family metallopeptidase [Microlunatus parietis]|uniref:Putative Zn-dependent peptidase n=1 Tax=Microlunatus parietis TaxID=682979 RepID=A0A7Y9LGK2_9ACTN|nr:pitrilysin family protein [Microlunatus parietis]NYE75286.1 putative Zn-dependent peptidase [Microlunatus parietis]